ncbi:MAG: choice-of-anchor Q domain-containing protein, partial [Anaerolineae bacterium]
SFDCVMPPIPSGPSAAQRTRILGAGWDQGCANPPELWGAERPWFIVNLTDSSHVELGCLEITDHATCVEFHSGAIPCQRDTPPYGPWASIGLQAEDSTDVYLHDLDVHGLASGGIHAGRLHDWTVERVRIAGNGWVGWDGDIYGGDSNSGALIFRRVLIEWNGCGETWPEGQPTGCWAQSAGGYGDGFATGATGGQWVFEDATARYNTSDGFDLLYVSEPGSSVQMRRVLAVGNAGNQIKNYRGPFLLENSIIVGNCGFFDGQPFTYDVDNCRALGAALAVGLTQGDQATITNNTVTSEGDCLLTAERYGPGNGQERVTLRNNLFQGQVDFLQPFELTCLAYQETFDHNPFDFDYTLANNVKDDACPGGHAICGVAPGLVSVEMDSFDAHLLPGSPALDAGSPTLCPAGDWRGFSRPVDGNGDGNALCDLGAIEWHRPEDVNGDGSITVLDVQQEANAWPCNANCAALYDQDGNGVIDVVDVQRVAAALQENPTDQWVPTPVPTVILSPIPPATPPAPGAEETEEALRYLSLTITPQPTPDPSDPCIITVLADSMVITDTVFLTERATIVAIGTVTQVMPARWTTSDGKRPENP